MTSLRHSELVPSPPASRGSAATGPGSERPRSLRPGQAPVQPGFEAAVGAVREARSAVEPLADASVILLDVNGVCADFWGLAGPVHDEMTRLGVAEGIQMAHHLLGAAGMAPLRDRETVEISRDPNGNGLARRYAVGAAPLIDKSSGRSVGAIAVVSREAPHVEWAVALANRASAELRCTSRRAEQALMRQFLEERSDSRHAVVALSDQIIITNAAAARTVGVEEQSRLWEHALRMMQRSDQCVESIEIGRGRTLAVRCTSVVDDGRTVGVIMQWRRPSQTVRPAATEDSLLEGLAGGGAKWRAMKQRLAALSSGSLLLTGEAGTGRASIGLALSAPDSCREVDAARADDQTVSLAAECFRSGHNVLLRHLEALEPHASSELASLVQQLPASLKLIGTMDLASSSSEQHAALVDAFGAVVTVPSLRDRPEDLPDLVRALTSRYVQDHPELDGVQWMTDALQALTRLDWPRNVASLEALVGHALSQVRTGYVTARDLPAGLAVRASGRRLSPLERIEAHVILQALKDASGNKSIAADSLGIARSTLYRKLRGLGVDLSASTF